MADHNGLGKLVPGFDFLQGLVKNAGAALPSIGNWIAPTLNPEELEKRIEELRTVQFWLEQNARMLAATIQALEVQRMTLSTLKTMNVSVEALRDSMTLSPPAKPAAAPAAAFQSAAPTDDDDADTESKDTRKAARKGAAKRGAPAAGVVDPMNWWGALTNQFTQLATQAMKDMVKETATEGAKSLATELVKQSFNAAEQTLKAGMAPVKKAASMAGSAAGAATQAATGAVAVAASAAKKSRNAAKKRRTGAAAKSRSGAKNPAH